MAEIIDHRKCDFCGRTPKYDGKTTFGPWAFMCERHFKMYGKNVKGLFSELKPLGGSTEDVNKE